MKTRPPGLDYLKDAHAMLRFTNIQTKEDLKKKLVNLTILMKDVALWLRFAATIQINNKLARARGVIEREYIWFVDNSDSMKLAIKCKKKHYCNIYAVGERPMMFIDGDATRLNKNKREVISAITKNKTIKYICLPHRKKGYIDRVFTNITSLLVNKYICVYDDGLNLMVKEKIEGIDIFRSPKKQEVLFGWATDIFKFENEPLLQIEYGYKEMVSRRTEEHSRERPMLHIIGSKYLSTSQAEQYLTSEHHGKLSNIYHKVIYYKHPNSAKCSVPEIRDIECKDPLPSLVEYIIKNSRAGDSVVCGYTAALRHLVECNSVGARLKLYLSLAKNEIKGDEDALIQSYMNIFEGKVTHICN